MPNPNLPQQVFVGTDWGLYYTDNINAGVAGVASASKACRT